MSRALGGLRIALAIAFTALVMAAAVSFAARNTAGSYALPSPGVPFIPGTTASSSEMNATLLDLGNEITSSLDRTGRGGMLASLRGIDGTVAAPAFSFTSEPATGFYKIGASDLGLALGGVKTHEWTATGETATGTFSTSASGTGTTTLASFFEPALANGNTVSVVLGSSAASNASGALQFNPNATAANSTLCVAVFGQTSTLCVDGNAKTTAAGAFAVTGASTLTGALAANGGAAIGASGTAISGSFRGTAAFSPGTIGANACGTASVTVTGAVQGSECLVGLPGGAGTLQVSCETTAANTCVVSYCNTTGVGITPTTGNVACRVFNP